MSERRVIASQPLEGEPEARVCVAGASGFAGALAARLVWEHPGLQLAEATARSEVGSRVDRLYPRHRVPVELTELDPDRVADRCDTAIVAYPHGAAAALVSELRRAGLTVLDLSADFRLRDRGVYEQVYGEHGAPELLAEAAYGLTELHRDSIRQARLVAVPGCYPTAALLAVAPLAEAGLVSGLVIDAKSGVSGAGRGGGDRLHFVNVVENLYPYAVTGHRHTPEISQELSALGGPGALTFLPHLAPLDQGLLASCYVDLAREVTEGELDELYRDRYEAEPFVELVGVPPGVRDVRETNACHVQVGLDAATGRAMAFAAIDNLWKGAAGQAIQDLNLILGLDEAEGLR